MKRWRSGFIRWRRREGPCGSHQLEARALKCETSVGSTEDACSEVLENERAGVDRGEVIWFVCWYKRERRLGGSRRRRACASVVLAADMAVEVKSSEGAAEIVVIQPSNKIKG